MTTALQTRTALYRLFDASDGLLYVGITSNPDTRFATHRLEKSWWPEVARKEITWYDSRAEADVAEAHAIRDESPTMNRALPDADNVYRRGVGRARFTPDEQTEREIDELVDLRRKAVEAEAAYKAKLAELAQPNGPVPIAHLADRLGVVRKTVYRHLGRSMT